MVRVGIGKYHEHALYSIVFERGVAVQRQQSVMPVAALEPAAVPRVRVVDFFRRVLCELEGVDVDMERVNADVNQVEAHGLAHGRAELFVVGFIERELRSRWHFSVVRHTKEEIWPSDVKR